MMENLDQKEQFEKSVKMDLMMDLIKKTSRFVRSLTDESTTKEVLTSQIFDVYCDLHLLVFLLGLDQNEISKRQIEWAKDVGKFSKIFD